MSTEKKENNNGNNKTPSLKEIIDKYGQTPIKEVSKIIRQKFLTAAYKGLLASAAGDTSLRFGVKNDKTVPTACIDIESGRAFVGKSLALACLDEKEQKSEILNRSLLDFIMGHEIGHYKDFYSTNGREKVFLHQVEKWQKWMKDLNKKIWKKWAEMHPEIQNEINQISEEDKEKRGSPLHSLYFSFFNKLDDPFANEHSLDMFPYLNNRSFDLSNVYDNFLFTSPDYTGKIPLSEQFGNFLLHKRMSPNAEIKLDKMLEEVLSRKHPFNGKQMTLMEILSFISSPYRGRFKNNYAAKRYLNEYEKIFIPAFEELLEIDKKDQEALDKFMEELQKHQQSQDQSGSESDQKQGEGQSNPNPFGKIIKKTEKTKEKAKKARKDKFDQNQKANKEAAKTDEQKKNDHRDKDASNFAKKNGLEEDKTIKYFEKKEKLREKINEFAKFIVAILLREKKESHATKTRHKSSGDLNINDLINNIGGLLSGDSQSRKVMERNIIDDRFKNRIIKMTLRMLLDNSGSMSGLKDNMEDQFILIYSAIYKANMILIEEYDLPNVKLDSELLIFGDEKRDGDPNSGGRLIKPKESSPGDLKNFDINMIKAFNKITCNEGTEDSDAWRMVDEDLFTPTEVQVEEGIESFSIALEITDGYTSAASREKTKNHAASLREKGVKVAVVFLENDQAMDQSEDNFLKKTYEKMTQATTAEERREVEREIMEKANEYKRLNQEKAGEGISNYETVLEEIYKTNWQKINCKNKNNLNELTTFIGLLMLESVHGIDDKLNKQKIALQAI